MHVPFEGPGIIHEWADERGHQLKGTHSYENEIMPHTDDFDFLIIMGGPQSACELEKYPYLQEEISLIGAAINADKPVLGICLGAQLIGAAFDAPASRSPEKEMGCFPVELTEAGKHDRIFKNFPSSFASIHWHNDMPGVPADAAVLAKSAGCPRQVIRYGEKVYGLQFHLEFTKEKLQKLIDKCKDDLTPSKYTQTAEEMLSANFKEINASMKLVLDQLTESI